MRANSIRRLDGQGRVILPAHIRKALNLTTDSEVTIELTEDGEIRIKPAEERCCICGRSVNEKRKVTIKDNIICWECTVDVQEMWLQEADKIGQEEEE